MNDPRKPIFDAVRAASSDKKLFNDPGNVLALDNLLDALHVAVLKKVFDRAEFIGRYVNTNAPAITDADIEAAADSIAVPSGHIRALKKQESRGKSFDDKGRPVILFEPHIFHRQTKGAHGITSFSYPKWDRTKYPGSFDGRWVQMADAAAKDEGAALESASWGLFQIMGFHWKALKYSSPQQFAESMAASEAGHLDALVRFISTNGLAPALRRCKAGDPDSCRDFSKGYNGAGYEANRYHIKFSENLR